MALTLTHIVVVFLLMNAISSHILIGRDVTQRKVFRTRSGGEFIITRPLTKGQKLMMARELLKDSKIELVVRFARNNRYQWIETQQCRCDNCPIDAGRIPYSSHWRRDVIHSVNDHSQTFLEFVNALVSYFIFSWTFYCYILILVVFEILMFYEIYLWYELYLKWLKK